jgi:hypothetical protein
MSLGDALISSAGDKEFLTSTHETKNISYKRKKLQLKKIEK